jgi:hypothetical protein
VSDIAEEIKKKKNVQANAHYEVQKASSGFKHNTYIDNKNNARPQQPREHVRGELAASVHCAFAGVI